MLHITPTLRRLRRLRRLSFLLACASVGIAAHAQVQADAQAAEVGRVSFQIGQSWLVRADGARALVQRDMAVHVGDRIETAGNGHVYMRFVDNASISVRPDSVLQIQAYHYDAKRPQANEVRLLVEKGATRSISGAATEVDKSRFRLNTPISAIGVRGTDFIVQTDAGGDKATVADGAIVVSPLGKTCAAAGLGPCGGADVRELSAAMGRVMAVVRPGDGVTRIVPSDPAGTVLAGETSLPREQRALAAARTSGLLAAEPTEAEARRGNDAAAADLLTLAAVGANQDLNRPSSLSGQLIWGHWALSAREDDKLSVPFALASLNRHVTVADDEAGLFRANQTTPGELFPSTLRGTAEFRLNRATAVFEGAGFSEAAAVNRSNLTIDFSRRSFATALDLTSASGIKGELRMGGDLRGNGLFAQREGAYDVRADQRVSGAVSLDGREAGYLFERSAAGGWFRGHTLWGP